MEAIFMRIIGRVFVAAAFLLCVAASFPTGAWAQKAAKPVVVIETSVGDITVELNPDKAPKSVENFLAYVKSGYYKGTIFHRVIKGFMIQGGGLTADLQRKGPVMAPILNEATNGLGNKRGTIAMARTMEVNSATSQFFINTVDNTSLDNSGTTPDKFGYAVFGKVTSGMSIVDKIENTATGTKNGVPNVPLQTITIKDVRLKS
jgi:cyclophilin family peptidyl-prolyl cis-trans isomerase